LIKLQIHQYLSINLTILNETSMKNLFTLFRRNAFGKRNNYNASSIWPKQEIPPGADRYKQMN